MSGERPRSTHAPDHALAAVFAHSHDAHGEHDHARGHDHPHDHGDEAVHRPGLRGAPTAAGTGPRERTQLEFLYRALSGHTGEIVGYDGDLPVVPESVHLLHLPAQAPVDVHHGSTPEEWYRVAVAHRAMHGWGGSFDLDLDRPEPLFDRLRPRATPGRSAHEQVAALFGRPALATELFLTLEDLRLDTAAVRVLPGLADAWRRAGHEALHDRPPLTMLGARDAVVEALVQDTLGAGGVELPTALRPTVGRLVRIADRLRDPLATVESTVEATIRVYRLLTAVPGGDHHRSASAVAFADLLTAVGDDGDPADPGTESADLSDLARPSPAGERAVTFHPVPFRDPVGARHVTGDPASGLPLEIAVLRLTPDEDAALDPGADGDGDPDPGGGAPADPAADGGDTERDPSSSPTTAVRPAPGDATPAPGTAGRLRPHGPREFVYPEWDDVAGVYLPDWTLVRTARASLHVTGRRRRVARPARDTGVLVARLAEALERVQPAGRDLVPRSPDGDDLDLDASVEAVADLRAHVAPSDRVFVASTRRRRDVAVAFAVDLSASTAEALPPDPDDPTRLRRVVDVQRDAVSVVAAALERVGDVHGIYGFSGSGRDDVRLTVVKDLDERSSPAVARRLAALRPDHTTRMGPVIRHLTDRLLATDAATRILLVVSDGRPFDIDYGQQHGEQATIGYALADTGRALAEARRAGVWPYLVSVDAGGGDYLSRICDPREYHVITDARELPQSLADLYVVARGDAFRRRARPPRRATPRRA